MLDPLVVTRFSPPLQNPPRALRSDITQIMLLIGPFLPLMSALLAGVTKWWDKGQVCNKIVLESRLNMPVF